MERPRDRRLKTGFPVESVVFAGLVAADTGRSLAVIEPPAVQFEGITMPEAVGAEVFKSFASNAGQYPAAP